MQRPSPFAELVQGVPDHRRGRPPVTRARVLHYVANHSPCTINQVCRGTGAERSHVKRILKNFLSA